MGSATLEGTALKSLPFLRQAKKFRIEYFDLVLHQDVGWFDLKASDRPSPGLRDVFFGFGQKRHRTKMME